MSNTQNFTIPLMASSQANGYLLFNGAATSLDDYLGRIYSTTTKTTSYAMAYTDGRVLTNQAGALTITLPPVASLKAGQCFAIQDISGTAQTNAVTIAVPTGVALDGVTNGTSTIKVAGGSALYCFDGTGFRTIAALDTRLKRRETIRLIQGVTPGAGAQVAEFVLPLGTDNASVTWVVKRIFFRVQTAGGAPVATVEKYTGTGAFSATSVGAVTLGSGASEGSQTSAFGVSTLTSGDKIRLNATTLATAANWNVSVELQEQ